MKPSLIPTKNCPNPAKFLKEVSVLVPALAKNGHIPLNREQRRAAKEQTKQRLAEKQFAEKQRRHLIIGKALDQGVTAIRPKIMKIVYHTGWAWLFKLAGISHFIEDKKCEVEGVPDIECTEVRVCKWGRVAWATRLVWENPQSKAKIVRA